MLHKTNREKGMSTNYDRKRKLGDEGERPNPKGKKVQTDQRRKG